LGVLRFLVRLFAVFGVAVFLGAVALGVWIWERAGAAPDLPERVVLELDLSAPLSDDAAADPFAAALFGREPSRRDVLDALERARTDPRVAGVVARFGPWEPSTADAQEIRAAVERLRGDGRFAIAWADSFGEFAGGIRAYGLAAGFDEVWLQPAGIVGITGLSSATPFARRALDRLGIDPQLERREAYKTFADTFTETGFTPEHREMTEALVADLTGQVVLGIAEGRRLGPDVVEALVDRAPLLDREALDARLVDRLAYRDEALAEALERAGDGAVLVAADEYLDAAGRPGREGGAAIALIEGTGAIQRGESGLGGLFDDRTMGADTIAGAFADAAADPAVQAIVFRIDSGGGSAVASETIRRALLRAQAAGKPVVVSMGGAAASGGYWIAADADRIVALPGTLTGSIGVVAGKFVVEELSAEIGVEWGVVGAGDTATFDSALRPFTPEGRARLDAFLDDAYRAFVERVAEGRDLDPEAVRAIAGGRVWTGRQAMERGLVDALGGLDAAVAEARRLAGVPDGAPVEIRRFPAPESPFARALELAGVGAAQPPLPPEALALLRAAAPLLRGPREEAARMPELGLR